MVGSPTLVILDLELVNSVDAENPIEGDLRLVDGDLVWTTDRQTAVSQDIRTRLKMFRGDYYLDETLGIPYLQGILGAKNPDIGALRSLFDQVIRGTPGVADVPSVQVELDGRTLTVDFEATLDGDADLSIRDSVSLVI